MAKILFILMPNYRDEEFVKPYNILKEHHTIDVAGLKPGILKGSVQHEFQPNLLLSDITDFDQYDALVIPGGPGSTKHLWHNETLQTIIKQFHENKKVIAAICYAVIPLAQAGILLHKHATVYPTDEAKDMLAECGGKFSKDGCVTLSPEKIITAQGPKFAEAFGHAIASLLS